MFRFGEPGGRMYGTDLSQAAYHWSNPPAGPTWNLIAGGGRSAGSCLQAVNGNNTVILKALTAQATWGVALAVKPFGIPAAAIPVASFYDGLSKQVDFRLNTDLSVSATRAGTVLGATAAGLIPVAGWTHLEFKVLINSTTGTVGLWVNGVQKLNLTTQNTQATANASATTFALGNDSGVLPGAAWNFDDVVVYDGQATDANGYADITGPIGDCILNWLLPTGPGATTQFAPSGAANNWQCVDDVTPDGDATYVIDANVGHIDTYTMADLPATATSVKSVAAVHYARKDDASGRGIKAMLRSAGANATHATETLLGNSYLYYWSTWGQNPNAGSPIAWTPTMVNAVESGQTVSS